MKSRFVVALACLCFIQGCTVVGAVADGMLVQAINAKVNDEHPSRNHTKVTMTEEGPFQSLGREIDSAVYEAVKQELETSGDARLSAKLQESPAREESTLVGLCPHELNSSEDGKCFSADYYAKFRAQLDADKKQ